MYRDTECNVTSQPWIILFPSPKSNHLGYSPITRILKAPSGLRNQGGGRPRGTCMCASQGGLRKGFAGGGEGFVKGTSRRVSRTPEFSYAVAYVQRVKNATSPEVFSEFLTILHHYDRNRSSLGIRGVTARVRELFRGHPVLYREFSAFLPKSQPRGIVERKVRSGDSSFGG
ncbi:hypothetical protein AAMO2058_000369200 [Amorphochlora amoebiformis]